MPIATVKFFNATNGFGFITPAGGGGNVFVDVTALESAGFVSLNQGLSVAYELEQDRSGKMSAVNLSPAS